MARSNQSFWRHKSTLVESRSGVGRWVALMVFVTVFLTGVRAHSQASAGDSDGGPARAPTWFEKFHSIETVAISQVADPDEEGFLKYYKWQDDCATEGWLKPKTALEDLDKIFAFGEKIWKIISEGRPVVTVTAPVAHALPASVNCWDQLEGWSAPRSAMWQVSYLNGFKSEVAKFKFRLIFNHSGSSEGRGRYLANATIVPAEVSVSWGFALNADVRIGRVVNVGTKVNPVAGMDINIGWSVKSPLKEMVKTENFFVQGDGTFIKVE